MAKSGKVGFAVVGLGTLARNAILPAFANCKRAKLVALVSRDKRKAGELAKRYKTATGYGLEQFGECLANPDISAVYIATPPGEHEELTVRAAETGKHVLCEKPLAAVVDQSARMVAACRRTGVLLMTAYRKYFESSTLYMKSLIDEGALGQLDMIHTSFSERYAPGIAPEWLLNPALAGGGPLMDLGVYCVNTSRWLAGEDPIEASAVTWNYDKNRFKDVEEGISFRLNFPSGLFVQGSSTYTAAMSSFLFVQGSKGWVSLTPAFPFDDVRHLTGKIAGRLVSKRFPVVDEFALEIDALASAILEKKTVEPDGLQGHRDMIILHAIYESARTQKPVTIHYGAEVVSHGA